MSRVWSEYHGEKKRAPQNEKGTEFERRTRKNPIECFDSPYDTMHVPSR